MDYLHPEMDENAVAQMTSLALAHVGDAVYELMVRALLASRGAQTAKNLHALTTKYVCAGAQARAAEKILPLLDEHESTVFRHGRNAKPRTIPKSASSAEYSYATGFETLFGWLYLTRKYGRLNELFGTAVKELGL